SSALLSSSFFRRSVRGATVASRTNAPREGADVPAVFYLDPSASAHGEIQLAEPVRIAEHVDPDDPAALDRHGHDRKRTPVGRPGDGAGYPVHEDPRRRFGEPTEGHRLLGNGVRAADQRDQTWTRQPAVGAQHDLAL